MPKVVTSLPQQIVAAAREAEDRRTAYQLALRQRDDLIIEAVDTGAMSQRKIAEACGFSGPQAVARILAKPHEE